MIIRGAGGGTVQYTAGRSGRRFPLCTTGLGGPWCADPFSSCPRFWLRVGDTFSELQPLPGAAVTTATRINDLGVGSGGGSLALNLCISPEFGPN